jgi:tRNA-2-methylthio-N6-dimethylallyladenosine synthase
MLPKAENLSDSLTPWNKTMDESRQGEVFTMADTSRISIPSAKKYYIESYGCQMNFSDSEIVASILSEHGFIHTSEFIQADLILINTCSIRENAEQRVRQRLTEFKRAKNHNPEALVGVLGCMAERLKSKFLEEEKIVDLVIGPDAYRTLPQLVEQAGSGQKGVNVLLSREETYADINPVRLNSNGITAFISIMRGCNNMCSFCVVPFTRGRERSRDPYSIIDEAKQLFESGYREITLLGQNVDSYLWSNQNGTESMNFAQLLENVALVSPELRVRFSTSHPKDITDEVLHVIAAHANICDYIHLPIQSGSSRVLEMMNRTYSREWYLQKIERIREIVPGCAISTDIIAGFCNETEEDHQETLSMMDYVRYEMAFMYKYSERPGTLAARTYEDNISEEVKARRLKEIVTKQMAHQAEKNKEDIGKTYEVLIEGVSRRSDTHLFGRNSQNKVLVFPAQGHKPGEYVQVLVESTTAATLIGKVIS